MKYFNKEFRKFTFQFIFIIFTSLVIIGAISDYLNGGGIVASIFEK